MHSVFYAIASCLAVDLSVCDGE